MSVEIPTSSGLARIGQKALAGGWINRGDAEALARVPPEGPLGDELFRWADRVRERFRGDGVMLCSIVPAKAGGCSEDCRFCAQSARYETDLSPSRRSREEVLAAARRAAENGALRFGIVHSGRGPSDTEVEEVCRLVEAICAELPLEMCASLGRLSADQARRLAEAGLAHYNHNLEVAESLYPTLVSTHPYAERWETIEHVRHAGLRLCCGGIFGLGEGWGERLDLAFALREAAPATIPLNFLHPIPGTPLAGLPKLAPAEAFKIIALFRLCFPDRLIKVAGGREAVLGRQQGRIFCSGADGVILGDYLTTRGNPPEDDRRMILQQGRRIAARAPSLRSREE